MTTRTTKDPPPAKEKRGTSPSTLLGPRTATTTTAQQSPHLQGPNPPKKVASPSRPNSSSSTSSEKSVPNYLKPTRSSGPEVSKQLGKKPTASKSEPDQKPAILRRRSFDKPPSVSQSLRLRVSPNPTLRSSSSFSGRTVTPPKKVPAKITKTPGKQPALNTRPDSSARKGYKEEKKLKTKVDISSAGKGKVVVLPKQVMKNVDAPDVPKPETHSGDIGDENIDEKRVEDLFTENIESASEPEQSEGEITSEEDIAKISDSIVEDQETMKDEQVDGDGEDRDAKILTFEHQEASEIEKSKGKSELDEDENAVTAEDSHVNDQEPLSTEHKEGEIEYSEVETPTLEKRDACSNRPDDTKQEELIKDDDISSDVTNVDESAASNESDEVEDNKDNELATNGLEGWEIAKEREEAVEKMAEAVRETTTVQMGHGKKEMAVSNDVIEETASKLREQRKNKVKALAGAFETVISLQEPK